MSKHLQQQLKSGKSGQSDTEMSQVYKANIVFTLDQFKFTLSFLL